MCDSSCIRERTTSVPSPSNLGSEPRTRAQVDSHVGGAGGSHVMQQGGGCAIPRAGAHDLCGAPGFAGLVGIAPPALGGAVLEDGAACLIAGAVRRPRRGYLREGPFGMCPPRKETKIL